MGLGCRNVGCRNVDYRNIASKTHAAPSAPWFAAHKGLVQRVADFGEGDGGDARHKPLDDATAQQQGHAQRAAQSVAGVGAGPLARQLAQRHLALQPEQSGMGVGVGRGGEALNTGRQGGAEGGRLRQQATAARRTS